LLPPHNREIYSTTTNAPPSTTRVGFKTSLAVVPSIRGHEHITCPAYSFLITNTTSSRHILFDLGVRADYVSSYPPWLLSRIRAAPFSVEVAHDVADILAATPSVGIKPSDIDTVIWSHHHWDHTGDLTKFPPETTLAVGPGLPAQFMPGYPANNDAPFLETDVKDRNVHEFDFFGKDGRGLKVGSFNAIDFFGDGSFYVLDTPGHTVGHICGLARTSTNPDGDTFVFMGGDASHHPGEFRASEYVPLPTSISPSPMKKKKMMKSFSVHGGCPGHVVQAMQRNGRADETFYVPSDGFNVDSEVALETIRGLQEFDAHEKVLMVVAHDSSLLEVMTFFPETMERWFEEGVGSRGHWRFLGDFEEAIDAEAE
jgi:glyoxylase-like metal-dependent hydrolase (beta-lactamase superfamily II)